MTNMFLFALAFSASLLADANPVVRRHGPCVRWAPLGQDLGHAGLQAMGPSRFSHAETRGHDGVTTGAHDYGLRDAEYFYWGRAGTAYANMTASTTDSNINHLAHLGEKVKFDALQAAWSWVNHADENDIVFVTDDCLGHNDDGIVKQAWHVRSVAFDDTDNTATLSAAPVHWEQAFSRWHLHFSSADLLPSQRYGVASRDVSQGSISLAADYSTDREPLASAAGAPTIACSPCGTTGELAYDFDIDVDGFSVTASVTVIPRGVGAEMTAKLAIEEALSEEASLTKTLFSRPIDGMQIGRWVSIGPIISVDLIAGVSQKTAKAELAAGVKMSIPDDSVAKLSMNSDDNTCQGWTPVFESTLADSDLTTAISVSATAGLQIRADFELYVKLPAGGKGLAAGLFSDAPVLTLSAEAKLEEEVCEIEDADAGLAFAVGVGGELAAFAGAGKPADLPNKFDITSVGTPIFSTCMAVTEVPSTSQSSAAPTISSSVPPWGNFSRRSFGGKRLSDICRQAEDILNFPS